MLITLNERVRLGAEVDRVHSPDRQERVVELRHMWVEMLFPDT